MPTLFNSTGGVEVILSIVTLALYLLVIVVQSNSAFGFGIKYVKRGSGVSVHVVVNSEQLMLC